MKKQIYLHLFLVGLACILVTALVCAFAFWQTAKQQTLADLRQVAQVMGTEMEHYSDPYVFLQRSSRSSSDLRFTWVDPHGTVLYDSYEEASRMPNHRERPEIAEALGEGQGSDARRSSVPWKPCCPGGSFPFCS